MNNSVTHLGQATPTPDADKTYVYLMKHLSAKRFKIGLSNSPSVRAGQLIEDSMICRSSSIQVAFPTRKRAGEVERSLHKALGDYRHSFNKSYRHDGDTEWFGIDGWQVAIELIKRMPIGRDEVSKLECLTGVAYLDHASSATDSLKDFENDLNRKVFENLRRMENVALTFSVLRYWCRQWQIKVSLEAVKMPRRSKRPMSFYILKIWGLHQTWSVAEMRLRYKLLDIDLYKFKTHASRGIHTEVSLVQHIEAVPPGVDLICMHLCSEVGLKRLPGGEGIHVLWQTILQNFKALTAGAELNVSEGPLNTSCFYHPGDH